PPGEADRSSRWHRWRYAGRTSWPVSRTLRGPPPVPVGPVCDQFVSDQLDEHHGLAASHVAGLAVSPVSALGSAPSARTIVGTCRGPGGAEPVYGTRRGTGAAQTV